MSVGRLTRIVAPAILVAALGAGCDSIQRGALFHPTHHTRDNGLSRWVHQGEVIGYAREVAAPRNVWLFLHGNGGQAADRLYALSAFDDGDAVFILEYPGYGSRSGKPSRRSLDAAAREAYALLRERYPQSPICVGAESIGSGPAAMLAREPDPPAKFTFVVPFDELKSVARGHVRFLPVGLLLAGTWDNVEAMKDYLGPVEVFGAAQDEVIPVQHARALARELPQAQFHLIAGGHNDWPRSSAVRFRNP